MRKEIKIFDLKLKEITSELSEIYKYNECVYMIEDFYIGRTRNLKNRCHSHLRECIKNSNLNNKKNTLIQEELNKKGYINFFIIDLDFYNELKHIKLRNDFICNIKK